MKASLKTNCWKTNKAETYAENNYQTVKTQVTETENPPGFCEAAVARTFYRELVQCNVRCILSAIIFATTRVGGLITLLVFDADFQQHDVQSLL